MKILYIMRSDIKDLPPVMSQLEILIKKGIDVKLISYFLCNQSKNWLTKVGVQTIMFGKKDIITKNKFLKYYRYFKYKKFIKKQIKNSNFDFIWVGSVETAMQMGNILYKFKYALNVFELQDLKSLKGRMAMKYGKKAKVLLVPEYNRAHIIRSMWKLNNTPYISENKPLYQFVKNDNLITPILLDYLNDGYKIILYQGVILPERDLKPLAKALHDINEKYIFVLMTPNIKDEIAKIKDIYKNTIYIGFIPAPGHLNITNLAHIGITTYDHSSLNTVFCAPNKIYEYAMMDVPILANSIPGLKYTVEKYNAGVCVDMGNVEEIIAGIKKINDNYLEFKHNTKKLFDSVKPEETIEKVLDYIGEY